MVNIKFVGFQEHVEIPDTFELLDLREEISCKLNSDHVFSLLSEPPMLSMWFYKVTSIDSKPGGKVKFLTDSGDEAEAICTSFSSGKEIAFLSNLFGEFSARIVNKKNDLKLHVRFKILTDNSSGMTETLNTFIHNLREITSL